MKRLIYILILLPILSMGQKDVGIQISNPFYLNAKQPLNAADTFATVILRDNELNLYDGKQCYVYEDSTTYIVHDGTWKELWQVSGSSITRTGNIGVGVANPAYGGDFSGEINILNAAESVNRGYRIDGRLALWRKGTVYGLGESGNASISGVNSIVGGDSTCLNTEYVLNSTVLGAEAAKNAGLIYNSGIFGYRTAMGADTILNSNLSGSEVLGFADTIISTTGFGSRVLRYASGSRKVIGIGDGALNTGASDKVTRHYNGVAIGSASQTQSVGVPFAYGDTNYIVIGNLSDTWDNGILIGNDVDNSNKPGLYHFGHDGATLFQADMVEDTAVWHTDLNVLGDLRSSNELSITELTGDIGSVATHPSMIYTDNITIDSLLKLKECASKPAAGEKYRIIATLDTIWVDNGVFWEILKAW
jgi:hypothetical protein